MKHHLKELKIIFILNWEPGYFGKVIRLRTGQQGFDSRHGRCLSLRNGVQTECGAHVGSYPVGTKVSFRTSKAVEA
jgi:hypothetical protein